MRAGTPLDLIEHRRQLLAVGPGVARLHAHDDPAFGVGSELQIVSGTKAAIGHLHHPRLGISGRDAGFSFALRMVFGLGLVRAQFGGLRQRLLAAFLVLARGAQFGRPLARAALSRILFGLRVEPLQMRARRTHDRP